ncbi:DUF1772 domain-containing protein [Sphingomonas cavernae]|uniref:DUF1772 domain-containing protein n=1 Tax=Sphingomonas cavernae TaxID=2320861 RepID=A0A418WKJ6_9SPHN|nr:anthrone oxygenase family protein [Sphingomonas cavernae]RJF90538.1 DUF1772 domain-containing protein [Sphingomonas cavernae]
MNWLSIAQLVAALGCALIAGTFFAFSTFVMQSLASRPPVEGMAAMQAINQIILRSAFLSVFLGTALLCAALAVYALIARDAHATRIVAASFFYVVGTLGVTMWANVPRNNALDRADPVARESVGLWQRYVREWTLWNHVRTIAATISTALFIGWP